MIAACTLGVCTLYGLLPTRSQAGAQEKPLMAEDVFKNVQALKEFPSISSWKRWVLLRGFGLQLHELPRR